MKNRMISYKLVIPIVLKDIHLLLNNKHLIEQNLGVKQFVIIGSDDIKDYIDNIENIIFIDENQLFNGLDIQKIKKILIEKTKSDQRAGWYFQQFLKMAYSFICEDEYYLVWDSDTLPLKKIEFFSKSNNPFFSYKSFEKNDLVYFNTINKIFNYNIKLNSETKSYVVEHMLFKTEIMKELIFNIENNAELEGNSFFEKILNSISKKHINLSGFSEFETYVAFTRKNYPDLYEFRHWNNLRCGKVFVGSSPNKKVLDWISKEFISISLERYDKEWKIFRFDFLKRINFKYIYMFSSPIIIVKHNIRMFLRKYFKNFILKLKNI